MSGLENGKSLCHLVSEGKKVAREEYKNRRHDNVSKILHCKECELTNWRGRKNGVVKVMWKMS